MTEKCEPEKPFRILRLHGGIKGIFTAAVLAQLEEMTGITRRWQRPSSGSGAEVFSTEA